MTSAMINGMVLENTMDFKNVNLMPKKGGVIRYIARELLGADVGHRLKTVGYYANFLQTGRGTVQTALKFLVDYGAIELDARGHLGTFIKKIDNDVLWMLTGKGVLFGAMPLPSSKSYEGLATGIRYAADVKHIPFGLSYIRGSKTRLEALHKGRFDFAVLSKLAAEAAIANGEKIEVIVDFGKKTYVTEQVIAVAEGRACVLSDGLKVGVDSSSYDHQLLTKKACSGYAVEFVSLPYNQTLTKLVSGEIDVAVWNEDEIRAKNLPLQYQALSGEEADLATTAVIVGNPQESSMKTILEKIFNKHLILECQSGVMEGKIAPCY